MTRASPALAAVRTVFLPALYDEMGASDASASLAAALRSHATPEDATALLVGHNPFLEVSLGVMTKAKKAKKGVPLLKPAAAALLRSKARNWAAGLETGASWKVKRVVKPAKVKAAALPPAEPVAVAQPKAVTKLPAKAKAKVAKAVVEAQAAKVAKAQADAPPQPKVALPTDDKRIAKQLREASAAAWAAAKLVARDSARAAKKESKRA